LQFLCLRRGAGPLALNQSAIW